MNFLYKTYYQLGFVPFDGLDSLNCLYKSIRYVKVPQGKWYADPFLFSVNDDCFVVLVEEFRYDRPIGRIAKLEIDRATMQIRKEVILLELPSHLSFPIFYRRGNDVYVYPENSSSGGLKLYKYDLQAEQLIYVKTLVNRPLVDAVMINCKGKDYIFATDNNERGGNGNLLRIYESNDTDRFDEFQTCELPLCYARSAGSIIGINDKLIRVAQDCTYSYGRNLVFQEVHYDENKGFSFETIKTVVPRFPQKGIHTFNICENWAVIDVYYDYFPFLRKIYFIIRHYLKIFSH